MKTPNKLNEIEQFAHDIRNGKLLVDPDHDVTVMACAHTEDRRLADIENSISPYVFDEQAALTAVKVVTSALKLNPPASTQEKFFIYRAFGWKFRRDNTRRYADIS